MKPITLYTIFALCLIAIPTTATNLPDPITNTLNDISISLLSEDDTSNETSESSNLESDKQLEQGIERYLPSFFEKNKQNLDTLQQANRQAVLVIGQTGSGKSTLISALLSHKLIIQQQKITETLENGRKSSFEENILINKTPHAPKIGHTLTTETTFPQAYLDQETNLAFIDTAGLADTRKDSEAINICNAIALRSLIQQIGSVKCIIGTITYNNFICGKKLNPFFHLLSTTTTLLKNKPLQKLNTFIVVAFTNTPANMTKEDLNKQLQHRCNNLITMRKNNEIKEEDKIAETIYKALFPSFYNIKNKKDLPFFLISQKNLLNENLIRNNILPTIQKATQIKNKDINLILHSYLLEKTRNWLTKKAQPVAKDIRNKQKIENNITHIQEYLSFKQKQLLNKEKLLKQLIYPNNKDTKSKKKLLIKNLKHAIRNNTKRITQLNLKIKLIKAQHSSKIEEINILNTHAIKPYKNIPASYDKQTNTYNYNYNDTPIHHITYVPDETKDPKSKNKLFALFKPSYKKSPKPNQRLSHNYKILSIAKNYRQGILNITLENSFTYGETFAIASTPDLCPSLVKHHPPYDFKIYAESKHIYHDTINILREAIENLEKDALEYKNQRKHLEKETKSTEDQCKQLELDLVTQERLIKETKNQINTKKKEIKNIKLDLYNFQNQLNLLNRKLSNNAITPYIITQVAPFIEFHPNQQHNINACKRYIHTVKKNNQDNNKHTDNQPGLWLGNNNNNLEDEEGEQKQNNSHKENISSSSNLTSFLLLGTTLVSGSLLKKKN